MPSLPQVFVCNASFLRPCISQKRDPVCCYTEALIDTLLAEKPASYTLQPSATEDEDADESHRTLTVKYYVYDTPVTLQFQLRPGTADELSECVILPLWRAVLLLDAKNRSLAEQLVKKDDEIAQYRAEGAELKRSKCFSSALCRCVSKLV